MPVRNGEKYVLAAINSVIAQTLEDFEFIIVDDGSTDATPLLLEQATRRDARIRVLTQASSGIVGALEAGRAIARAPLIARMDADDVAMPDRLALQADYLDANPDVVAVGGQVRNIDEHGAPQARGRFPIEPRACRAYLAFGAPHCHPAVMLRRCALDRVGGYRRVFEPAEDLDLWLRLSTIGELANLEQEVLQYRRHSGAVTLRRAEANARAACMARLEHQRGETAVPPNWFDLHAAHAEWSTIEAILQTQLRLEARASYLQALTLNGGITEPKAWAHLKGALPELATWSRTTDQIERFAFMIVRAAYQLARSRQPSRALLALGLGLRYVPIATVKEAISSLHSRLAAEHLSRAGSKPAAQCTGHGVGT